MPTPRPSASARPVLDPRPDPSPSSASPAEPHSSILPDGPRTELPLSVVAAASGPASSSSSAAAPPTPTSSSSSSRAPGPAAGGDDDIEMEPIVGHRRRKSSLMNPVGGISAAPGRPRAPSLRSPHTHAQSQFVSLSEEPKISEEGGPSDGPAPHKDEQPRDSFSDEDLQDDEETGLTDKERRKRQKKRRRNTMLDQRIAREKSLSADEQKEADKTVVRRLLINGGLILLWYAFSLSISLVSLLRGCCAPLMAVSVCATCADAHPFSTTSGCSTRTTSTSHSRFSQPRCTCSYNSPSRGWSFTLSPPYGPRPRTIPTRDDRGTIRSPTPSCPRCSTLRGLVPVERQRAWISGWATRRSSSSA